MDLTQAVFYVVQNAEGKLFRRKGYGGYGETWVTELDTARVWTVLSGARQAVTFFANQYPDFPIPQILKLTCSSIEILDETARVEKARESKRKEKEKSSLRLAKHRLQQAERYLKHAQETIEKEKKKLSS